MKILGIVGSNRKNGNSYLLLREMFRTQSGIETKIIEAADLNIKPCELCFDECSEKPFECIIEDDFDALLEEMKSADGIVIVCPFYFYIPSRFQPFLERLNCLPYFTVKRHGEGHNPLFGKPCALIVVSASGSSFNAFQVLHHLQEFALVLRMKPVTTNFWPFIGLSAKSGDIQKGAILEETESIAQGTDLLRSLVLEIERGSAG
ncbi:MAG: NAD(P)H-dependent oxidoreductase [Candidatus Zixiibacteriota bacterium]